jgi:hypothetical protein
MGKLIYASQASDIALKAREELINVIDEMVFHKEDGIVKLEIPIELDTEVDCPIPYCFKILSRKNNIIELFDQIDMCHIDLASLTFNELYSFIQAFESLYDNAHKIINLKPNKN